MKTGVASWTECYKKWRVFSVDKAQQSKAIEKAE